MRHLITILIITLSLSACNENKRRDYNILVEIDGKQLSYNNVQQALPNNISSTDSLKLSNEYVDAWIKHRLLLNKAELNVNQNEEIDELVTNYKEQLLIEKYLELLVERKADIKPTEDQIQDFYNKNKEQYTLPENILKGIFVILPLDASNKKTLLELLKAEETDHSLIESYCLQNSAKVDFFQEEWMTMRSIKKHLPEVKISEDRILTRNHFFETEDSLFNYILKIEDYKLKGHIAPLGYVADEIEEFLLNNNKISYLHKMEKDLYNDAKRKGLIQDNR